MKQVPSWLLLSPLSSSGHCKAIYVDTNVSVRCLRENENTEYTCYDSPWTGLLTLGDGGCY